MTTTSYRNGERCVRLVWLRWVLVIVALQSVTALVRPASAQDIFTGQASDADWQLFDRRIRLLLATHRAWIAAHVRLDAPQQEAIALASEKSAVEEVARFRREAVGQGSGIRESMPSNFARLERNGSLALKEIELALWTQPTLTPEARNRLLEVFHQRSREIRSGNHAACLHQLDDLLCFTKSQRESLTRDWKFDVAAFDEIDSFGYVQWNEAVPGQGMRVQFAEILPVLTADQLRFFSGDDQPYRFGVQTLNVLLAETTAEHLARLEQAALWRRDMMQLQGSLRVAGYRDEFTLPDESWEKLKLAAKGAAVQSAEAWREDMLTRLQEALQGRLKPGQLVPDDSVNLVLSPGRSSRLPLELLKSPIWMEAKRAVFTTRGIDPEQSRNERGRQALTLALLNDLDRELWLTASQRAELKRLVERSLPKSLQPPADDRAAWEKMWLAHPLLKIRDQDLAAVLNPEQQAVWTVMKSFYARTFGSNQVHYSLGPQHSVSFTLQE